MAPPDPSKPAPDPEKQLKVMKVNMLTLLQTIESLKTEHQTSNQRIVELQGIIEKDKLFNVSTSRH